jgi:predicted DNA-binding ribbon-helix-helix protein
MGVVEPLSTEALDQLLQRASKAQLVSYNINVGSRRTSIRLEPDMWRQLQHIAFVERTTVDRIVTDIHQLKKPDTSLTSGLRYFIFRYFYERSKDINPDIGV